jgi:hypothetical protein
MKTVIATVGFFTLLLFTVHAQDPRGPMMLRDYDMKTETTIAGIVTNVERVRGMHANGLHLFVMTESRTVEVHLGPADFVEKTLKFQEGNTVQILGSNTTKMGRGVMLAREVKKGEKVLQLRNEDGIPLWPAPAFIEETPEDCLRG